MTVTLVQNSYGKSRVRLLKVARDASVHDIQNLTINIALEGDFDAIHTDGDNSACLPTDTMKNTVYALAGETRDLETIEGFGRRLAAYLLQENPHFSLPRNDLM
jgi:urate oxidase